MRQPETVASAGQSLYYEFEGVLIQYRRIDEKLYFVVPSTSRNQHEDYQLDFTLKTVQPEIITVPGDRDPALRRGFRCGRPLEAGGINWLTLNIEQLGIPGVPGPLPIYVQSHVLHRFANDSISGTRG